jgi:hypothetical protein
MGNFVHAFLLTIIVHEGGQEKIVSNDMYWRSLQSCQWYARKIHSQARDKITAYCLPRLVDPQTVRLYDD